MVSIILVTLSEVWSCMKVICFFSLSLSLSLTHIHTHTHTQTWKGNMDKAGKTTIKDSKSDFTKVSFKPDLSKFKMTHLDKDTVAIMTRRAYDLAGCTKGVSVYLNGTKLPVSEMSRHLALIV